MPENQTAERKFQTMLMLYQRLDDDIHEFQRRQWHVVYYALLLFSGMVGLLVLARDWRSVWFSAQHLCWLVPAVWGLAVFFVIILEPSIVRARGHIKRIWRMLEYSAYYQEILSLGEEDIEKYDKWWRDLPSLCILLTVLTGAAGLVMWFLADWHWYWVVVVLLLLAFITCACLLFPRGLRILTKGLVKLLREFLPA